MTERGGDDRRIGGEEEEEEEEEENVEMRNLLVWSPKGNKVMSDGATDDGLLYGL